MVELRSRTHLHSQLHSIRAIKDGSIKILLNVKGKSKLRFRHLVDVYNLENTEDDESIPRIQPRELSDLANASDMTRGSCMFGPEVNIKTDPEDFNMTLEKIRKQCREKKRKLRNRGDIETTSQVKVKQESLTFQTEDEGCDLEEPLSNWETKFSKRRKRKQERKTKCGSTSSPSAEKADLPALHHVKPEASWDDSYTVHEAIAFIPTDPLLDSIKEPESTTCTELVEEIMHDSSKDRTLSPYCSAEPNSPGMVAIEEPVTTLPVDEAIKDASEEFNCLTDSIDLDTQANSSVPREEIELEAPQSSESETIGCVKNLASSNTSSESEEVKEDEESNDAKPCLDKTITGIEIVMIEAPEVLSNSDMTMTGVETVKIEAPEVLSNSDTTITGLEIVIEAPEILSNLDMAITGLENLKIEAPEKVATDYSGLLTMENTEIVLEAEDIAKVELPEATDILQLTSCCNSLDSVTDDSKISLEEVHRPERSSGNVDEAADQSSQLLQSPEEVKTAEETDSNQHKELHSQPEKLLSGRKALSPNSQAKLRKAMEHPDSPEKRSKRSKGKLYFSSQNSHRILKAQGLDSIDRVEVTPNSKQAIRKANNNTRQTQYQRATHKFPRRETQTAKPQPFSTGSTSLQGCTQKAIAFSQGQIRDFQYVAAKLTKELKTMRQITKRCLLAESSPSKMPDCNLDEVRTLIGNAEKTEESSKKWISMIERDCNRFCKLMGMVREDSPATENILHKKKKIRFADDAGGDLCHVKVFDFDLESES
ncbi:unnamed protein product [Thlaspi arvense]|uniref:Uncharacterized protein n=1 Tax=Thlaspi arvense TaxID=13288 RepID=A0AAU9SA02_THLAR|nr:unnamed protein product [Thlaspi arvense]